MGITDALGGIAIETSKHVETVAVSSEKSDGREARRLADDQ
jgi:hypothetical protein